jgi:hypothetical protein
VTYEVTEDAPLSPENRYGQTKLVGEWLVRDSARAWGLRAVSLRYVNVAGAGSPELGDPLVMNLVTMLLQGRSLGQRPKVFGGDYPTRDGSCVRDFVHVRDVARAHIASLDYLSLPQRPWDVFNVGTGTGSTVLEVVRGLAAVSGWNVEPEICPRRPGDPASVVASVDRIAETWAGESSTPCRRSCPAPGPPGGSRTRGHSPAANCAHPHPMRTSDVRSLHRCAQSAPGRAWRRPGDQEDGRRARARPRFRGCALRQG